MMRGFGGLIAAAGLMIATVLVLDGPGLGRQLTLGGATALFLYLLVRLSGVDGRQVLIAIIVASTGEVVLSLGWGLYTYRDFVIPLYVPPGHGVFFVMASLTALQPGLRRHTRTAVVWVLISGSVVALVSLLFFRDVWGLLWWIAAAGLLVRSKNQLLLASCFSYTILLEWFGTALGNWSWTRIVPGVGLTSANPPSGVGILYILLDLIVVALTTRLVVRPYAPTDGPDAAENARSGEPVLAAE